MNGGPYRSPSQPDGRAINRSGASASTYRASDEPREAEAPRPAQRPTPSQPEQKSTDKKASKWFGRIITIIVVVAVLAFGTWFVWSTYSKNNSTGIDGSKYQAVFLSNGQIYFGKLSDYNNESFRLTTGYYAQAKSDTTTEDATTQDTTTEEGSKSGIVLVRLADETYGPDDELFITKEQILHYENLKSDSQYAKLIDQNEASKK